MGNTLRGIAAACLSAGTLLLGAVHPATGTAQHVSVTNNGGFVVSRYEAVATNRNGVSSDRGPAITDGQSALNPGPMLAVGTKAPDFMLPTIKGKQYQLARFRGHRVLLEFIAVWCPHCQAMASALNRIDRNFKGHGLRTLAVLANPYGKDYESTGDTHIVDKADVAWFDKTYKVQHPTLIDRHWKTVNAYGANSYPTIYVLDKKGIVRYATTGEQPYAELAKAVTAAAT